MKLLDCKMVNNTISEIDSKIMIQISYKICDKMVIKKISNEICHRILDEIYFPEK